MLSIFFTTDDEPNELAESGKLQISQPIDIVLNAKLPHLFHTWFIN